MSYYSGFYSSLEGKNLANGSDFRFCLGFKYDFLTFIVIKIHFLAKIQNYHHLLKFDLSESCKSVNNNNRIEFII